MSTRKTASDRAWEQWYRRRYGGGRLVNGGPESMRQSFVCGYRSGSWLPTAVDIADEIMRLNSADWYIGQEGGKDILKAIRRLRARRDRR